MHYAWFLFGFEGRINRAKYWLAVLIIVCWMLFLAMLMFAVGSIFGLAPHRSFGFGTDDIFGIFDPTSLRSLSSADILPLCFKAIGTPLFLWVYVATSIKRLHDRDRSSWWMIPFFAVPGFYGQFSDRLGDSIPAMLVAAIVFVLLIWSLVETCYLRGTRGQNRFGADPLAPRDMQPRSDQQSELEIVPHSAGPSRPSHVKRGHE